MPELTARGRRSLIFVILILSCPLTLLPQLTRGKQAPRTEPHLSAAELAREVVHNELNAEDQDKSLWMYREVHEEDGKIELSQVVETNDGEVHRLLAVNGSALNDKDRQNEDRRIQKILANPGEFREKQKNAQHDAEQERQLLEMLPDAFLYQYDGADAGLIKLKFLPNPAFHANDRESEVFHHMEGTMIVDPQQNRLAELDGRLVTDVKFWGGLLGHLDKGGTFSFKQADVGSGHWEMVELNVEMGGKALFFKTISVHEKQSDSDFHALPDQTTLKQAAELLSVKAGS